jgi:hypothetical protein
VKGSKRTTLAFTIAPLSLICFAEKKNDGFPAINALKEF